jgi:hypothetical protein
MNKDVIAQNAACNAIVQLVDQGSLLPTGRLGVFDDSTSTLAWLNFFNPAYMDSTNGMAIAHTIRDGVVLQDGTASWFGVYNRDSIRIWTGTISDASGNGDLKLDSTVLLTDQTVEIASAYYYVPV